MTDSQSDTLRRLDGENDHQYLWRVCSAKDCGVIAMNWTDLAGAINRELHPGDESKWLHECVYRKEYRAAKEYYDNVFCHMNSDETIAEIEAQKLELRKEKQQVADQRRELRKHERAEARAEHLHNIIREAASNMPSFQIEPPADNAQEWNAHEAVLFLNDWHYGMTTDNIWNRYNTDICKARVNELYVKVCRHLQTCPIRRLHIVLLGDMCHGAIHTSARVESEENVCTQLMNVSELIASLVGAFAQIVPKISLYSTYGNHMRTIQNKHDSTHSDNMEKIIPWYLEERLRSIPTAQVVRQNDFGEIIHIPVCGRNILAVHGDLDGIRNSGTTLHTAFSKRYGINVDYVVLGDKHHAENVEALGVDCTIAPALCGTDGYAHCKRLYSEPAQIMMLFNEREGQECVYRMVFSSGKEQER